MPSRQPAGRRRYARAAEDISTPSRQTRACQGSRRLSLRGSCLHSETNCPGRISGFSQAVPSNKFPVIVESAGVGEGGCFVAQLMRTSNPAFRGAFGPEDLTLGERMTVSGTVNKTGILTICVVATAAWTWNRFLNAGDPDAAIASVSPLLILGGIGGFIVAMVTIFKK